MQLRLSFQDGLPFYQQIVNQVKYAVASGRLAAGEGLPSVRRLAEQLLVNPNTIARAYRELEREGVVVTRQGAGVYIGNGGSPLAKREQAKILSERIDALLAEARHLNVDVDEIVRLVRERGKHIKPVG
jgi:GntR family transcriptional regulator